MTAEEKRMHENNPYSNTMIQDYHKAYYQFLEKYLL